MLHSVIHHPQTYFRPMSPLGSLGANRLILRSPSPPPPPRPNPLLTPDQRLTRDTIRTAVLQSRVSLAKTLLIPSEPLLEIRPEDLSIKLKQHQKIIWLKRTPTDLGDLRKLGTTEINIPTSSLDEGSRIRSILFLALIQGVIQPSERVTVVTGKPGNFPLQSIHNVLGIQEIPWLTPANIEKLASIANKKVFFLVLDLALRIAEKGLEGKPIGTTFVIGNWIQAQQYLQKPAFQIVWGKKTERNVNNPKYLDALWRWARLDGAFFISGSSGQVMGGELTLKPSGTKGDGEDIRQGGGSRHKSAQAFTKRTTAISIVISETTGNVTVYAKGEEIIKLEQVDSWFKIRENGGSHH